MKKVIRQLLLGSHTIPEYAVVGLPEPQDRIGVHLQGPGLDLDVTSNNVVASLRPLRVATALPRDLVATLEPGASMSLLFRESQESGKPLGVVALTLAESKPLADHQLCLFEVRQSRNYCVQRWRSSAYYWYRWWSHRRQKAKYNHQMARADLHSFLVLYTCPRPVALISIQQGGRGNIFPMDLIGPICTPYFLLALHSTSPALEFIKASGRIVMNRVPVELASAVYELGKNHRVETIDWDTFGMEVTPSPTFGVPMVRAALGAVELLLEDSYQLGSHTLLVTRQTGEQTFRQGLRMCHVQGFCHDYLSRTGRGF